ncbi:M12 family metallo-peptidase [Pseudomonas sp. MWU13-2105]|uniref:M12 family metallo-peptidase n=1 Tax=Pseudomonas sp. MWU13-2105 TaxID=2935074 RepID=UPI00200FC2F2|nr:M12 family metallo-peptidase [Pseudomonas sp. MWU13-2105]
MSTRPNRFIFHSTFWLSTVASMFIQNTVADSKLLAPTSDHQPMTNEANAIVQYNKSTPSIVSTLITQADISSLTPSTQLIELNLTPDLTVSIGNLHLEKNKNDNIAVWHGQVKELRNASDKSTTPVKSEDSDVTLAVNGTMITGTVRYATELYRIVPLGGQLHAIFKLDESRFPSDDNDTVEIDQSSSAPVPARNTAHSERAYTKIRVLLVMSNNARPWITDPQGLAAAMLAEANNGLVNSNIDVRFESAGIFPINYNERGSGEEGFGYSLADLKNNAEVRALRDARAADSVVMLVVNNALRGKAYLRATRDNAFAVVSESAATGQYTFGHELGHNIGAGHENSEGPIAYAHAYHKSTGGFPFSTMMSSTCAANVCPRINAYSSPSGTWFAQPTGVAGISDNARVIRERAGAVADFMPELSPVAATPTDFWDALPRPGNNSIRLAWNASSGAAGYEVKELNTENANPRTTTGTQIVLSDLPNGYHTFQLRAYDSANRFSLPITTFLGIHQLPKPTGYRISRNSEGTVLATWDPDPQGRLFPSMTTVSGFPTFPSILNFAVLGKLPSGVTYHFQTYRYSGNLISEPVEITTAVP